jgi:hypothetical protein
VRNLRNKNHVIKPKTYDTFYDLIALTETFFDNGNSDEEYFCDKFTVFRCDRSKLNSTKSSGGGTLIAIKKSDHYTAQAINLDEFGDLEIAAAKIILSSCKCIFVFCVYVPPDYSNKRLVYDRIIMAINSSGITDNDIVLLLGDFNMCNIKYDWNREKKLVPRNFTPNFTADFFSEINILGLRQLNYVLNHANNVLDLIFLNDELEYDLHVSTNPLVKVDKPHPPIECTVYNVIPKRKICTKDSTPKERLDYARTDFAALNNYFRNIDLTSIVKSMELNNAFECFYNTMTCAFNQFVPKVKIRQSNSCPWYNVELKKLEIKETKNSKSVKMDCQTIMMK